MFWYTLIKTSVEKLINHFKPRKPWLFEQELIDRLKRELSSGVMEWKWTVKFQRQSKIK
jgi:hypothetical protein